MHTPEVDPSDRPTDAQSLTVVSNEVTLADYAAAKALPVEFLKELGLRDRKRDGKTAVSIPYLDASGQVVATRYRIAMQGDRFRWRSGAKPQLYGLWRLEDARQAGHVVIVEGESDCQTAWFHGVPAVAFSLDNPLADEDIRYDVEVLRVTDPTPPPLPIEAIAQEDKGAS